MRAIIACALLAALAAANSQHFAPRHRGGSVYKDAVAAENAHHARIGFLPNKTANWISMPVEHGDTSLGTFQDKFYYDTQYWNGTGPCMFYLNGEGPLHSAVGGYMADLSKDFGACTLSLEHRWYGDSLPAPLTNKSLLTRTLTIDQAMQDVMFMIAHFQANVVNTNVTWFLVGGSYSGGMTVWLNEKYPGFFKASWAASGVVKSTFAYYQYDYHVKSVTSQDCSNALVNVMQIASALYDESAASRSKLFQLFNVPAYHTKADFMWAMADASASSVQYGMKTAMCNGILPQQLADPWAVMRQYMGVVTHQWGAGFMASCYYSTECLRNSSMSSGWSRGGYSWIWECCNEVAWWQIGYPDSIRNVNVSLSYFVEQCRAAFYPSTMAKSWDFNDRHHGLQPVTQGYIVATQGSDDPWSTTGLYQSPGPNFPVNTAQCTNCGHCGAMMSPKETDPAPLVAQRELVRNSLLQWLLR